MPAHRDIIQVVEDAHAKHIDRACNGFNRVSREWDDDCTALYLSDKSRGLDPDRLVQDQFVCCVDSSRSRDEVGACRARRSSRGQQ
jgi:hypothetical protein